MKKIVGIIMAAFLLGSCQKEEIKDMQPSTANEYMAKSSSSSLTYDEINEFFTSVKKQLYGESDTRLLGVSFVENDEFRKTIELYNLSYDNFIHITLQSDKADEIYDLYTVNSNNTPNDFYTIIIAKGYKSYFRYSG